MTQHIESLHVRRSLSQRKHGDDGGKTEDDGGGPGSSSGGGGGGPGPGSQAPTTSPPQTTTVTTVSTSTRTFVSISTKPAQGNTDSSSNGPTPTPGPVRAPPSPTQGGPQSGSDGLKVAPTTNNQDTSSPATSPAPGSSPPSGGSPPPSSNPSSSSPSSVVFVLNNPANTTVCDSLLLSWSYVGQSPISLTLAVQEQNSPFGNAATASPPSPSQPRILSTNVSSSAANYHWNPVDVKEGWYNAHAYDTTNTTGISASSPPFFVAQGSDTTCLLALGPTQSSTPNASQPNSSTRIPIGDIVGIALGVTAGILGLITAFVLPRMRKRTHDSKPLLDTPKTITKKKWPRLLY